jgi:ribosomal protein L11 methyltransferase
LIRLAVRCRPEAAEIVLAELSALVPEGVEEDHGPGWVEYAIYGAPGELPALGDLEATAGEALVEVTTSEVPDDWADAWQEFHRSVLVGGRVNVRPSWEPPNSTRGAVDVVIDPGRAFGTGAHPTTRLCLEALLGLAEAGEAVGPLADLGTGSGVLAIAAAKLGWSPVKACDREQAALEAAAANAAANGVEVELARVDVRTEPPPPAATLVANLTAPLLVAVAEQLAAVEPPRQLVCSGLLPSESEAVVAAFAKRGLDRPDRRVAGDWAAISFRRR